MVRHLFLFFSMIFSIVLGTSQSIAQVQLPDTQALLAYVDRTEVSLNESFTLTIRVDARVIDATPDLRGLDRDFEQLGISRSSSYDNTNGVIQSWSEYRIVLRAKAIGVLTIPAFRMNSEISQPISVTVNAPDLDSNAPGNEIFLTTTVNKERVYVQEQLLYTIKLYSSISFDQGAQLTNPEAGDAVVQQFGSDSTFQEVIDGIRYSVTQRQFIIYPQSSGELTISPIVFEATVGRRRNGLSRLLNNRNSSARTINLSSDSYELNVLATPDNFPGQNWLPASELTLTESWSAELNDLSVGEAITRNITISAAGLSSSLLPDIEYPEIDGVKFYPDQPVRNNSVDASGIIGSRTEGSAIVSSVAGEFIIPEITIPWWNTNTDSLEIARIPARTLSVHADANALDQSNSVPSSESVLIDAVGIGTTNAFTAQTALTERDSGLYLFWIAATVLFASAWLFSTYMWVRERRFVANIQTPNYEPQTPAEAKQLRSRVKAGDYNTTAGNLSISVKAALRQLRDCCKKNNPDDIKQALLRWAQEHFSNPDIDSLEQLKSTVSNPELISYIDDLQKTLYSSASKESEFNPVELYKAVTKVQKDVRVSTIKKNKEYDLPSLYKN